MRKFHIQVLCILAVGSAGCTTHRHIERGYAVRADSACVTNGILSRRSFALSDLTVDIELDSPEVRVTSVPAAVRARKGRAHLHLTRRESASGEFRHSDSASVTVTGQATERHENAIESRGASGVIAGWAALLLAAVSLPALVRWLLQRHDQ